MEDSMEAPQNTKQELPYYPAIPLLGLYPKECKSGYNKGTCTLMFITALFTIAKLWEQPRCPTTDEWNFIPAQRRMKFCHLQVSGWKWRTSF
jgi:hypothetical protein